MTSLGKHLRRRRPGTQPRSASRLTAYCLSVVSAGACLRSSGLLSTAFSVAPPPNLGANPRGKVLTADGAPLLAGLQVHEVTGRRPGRALRAMPEMFSSFQEILDSVPAQVETLGPLGPLYFLLIYVLAECVALPATPLTLSAGYLFGLPLGCAVSLAGGTIAAGIGFLLSRTLLRPQITEIAEGNETFQNINRAVEREGFKIILLLRLSPLLPFSLSNYLYGLSNVNVVDFIAATALGFAPGTCAYVYLATTARDVLSGTGEGQPWYVYAVGIAVTLGLLKVASDIAKQAVDDAIEADKAAGKPTLASGEWSYNAEATPEKSASVDWMDSIREKLNV